MTSTLTPTPTHVDEHGESGNAFDRARQVFGLIAAPIALVLMLIAPLPLDGHQQRLAAVMVFAFLMWVTEAVPIPVSSLIALGLCVALQIPAIAPNSDDTPDEIVYGAFGDSTIFLVIGGFILARAMTVHGLDRRFALWVLSLPGVANSTARVAVAFGLIGTLVSAFVSNSAAAAMLLPIGIGIVRALGPEVAQTAGVADATRTRFATMMMLMIAYGVSVGGLLTPIGSTANVVGLGFLDQRGINVSFLEWVSLTAPLSAVLFLVMCVVVYLLNRPETRALPGAAGFVRSERASLGRWSRGERNTLIAFAVALSLWFGPSVLAPTAMGQGPLAWLVTIDIGTAAILAAGLLFVLPISWRNREFTLTWKQAVNLDWGTVLLVGAGLVLGTLMDETGLAEVIGTGVVEQLGLSSHVAVTVAAVVLAVVISETTSNTASVGVVTPVVLPIAAAAGMDPTIPALAAIFGASCGFMLPVSTPPNAIVYGSGMVPITKMFRTGIIFDVLAIAVVSLGVIATASIVTVT